MKRFKNILLVVDPELMDDAVLERAVALAQNNQARLTVVMARLFGSTDMHLYA